MIIEFETDRIISVRENEDLEVCARVTNGILTDDLNVTIFTKGRDINAAGK